MASPALVLGELPQPQETPPDPACKEAQKWIEQVTGRSFGGKDFRTGLENGILLCELLNAIKPGLVKKINRLPTPIAGLDNITLFLRGCKELGLKESQLFDPGDLQDTSNRTTVRVSDCNRKLRNVLVTVYWLGKAANCCISYSGNHLDLKEFEGLLAQMRKENEEIESPKRSIRDSGYIDCWDSERSDSLSPPRHGRDDSFDSLDSFGSRSQQTPSPDVVLRGSSDGRGSDSESDLPHRRLPDVRKDDMSARRVSFGENKAFVPFNQYLPNKSNQTAYMPAPLRKKKTEREDCRKSWSTATSPLGGERPFSQNHSGTIEEEENDLHDVDIEAKVVSSLEQLPSNPSHVKVHSAKREDGEDLLATACGPKVIEEVEKLKSLEQAGIKVMPASIRYSSQKQSTEDGETDTVLRKENAVLMCSEGVAVDSEEEEEEEESRVPDIERDDLATRRAKMNQPRTPPSFNQYMFGSYLNKTKTPPETSKSPVPLSPVKSVDRSHCEYKELKVEKVIITRKENSIPNPANEDSDTEGEQEKLPDIHRDDLAKRKTTGSLSRHKEPLFFATSTISKTDLETWQRLKVSSEDSDHPLTEQSNKPNEASQIDVARATSDDFVRRKLTLQEKRSRNKQKFVHFGPVTEIDQQKWDRLCIARAGAPPEDGTDAMDHRVSNVVNEKITQFSSLSFKSTENINDKAALNILPSPATGSTVICKKSEPSEPPEKDEGSPLLDIQRDDMLARRTGAFQKLSRLSQTSTISHDRHITGSHFEEKCFKEELFEDKLARSVDENKQLRSVSANKDLKLKSSESVERRMNKEELIPLKEEGQEVVDYTIESDTSVLEKDDMMARRISLCHKQAGVGLSQFLPVPFSVLKNEKPLSSTNKEQKPMSSIPTDPIMPNVTSEAPTLRFESPTMPHQPDAHTDYRDEHVSQPQACDPDQSHSVVNPFCSDLSSQPQATGETYDQEILRFSPRSALSDESMSMYDMRYEEEGSMLPHSRAHQEHLQTVNDLLKEEDETWQDDLAKWKTRRRSASQDLIKREQERKKMERLLSGDSDSSERRKSIKTYKEIVEEKERRERELHEAYKNARTKEEAEKILQKYIERFTISEAVLERLVMPKILERSHSVEPGLVTSSEDPNPLKYLRQQSLPSPKYTATVEAVISSPSSESECKVLPSVTSPNKNVISKTVPMLTAKPYSQPKNTQHVLKTFKVDGKASLNGETCNGMDQKDRGCGNLVFAHSLTRSQLFEGKARVDEVTKEKKPDVACLELSVTRCDIQNSVKELHGFTGTENHVSLGDELASNVKTEDHSVQHYTKGNDHSVSLTQVGSSISSIELTPCIPLKESAVNGKVLEEERKVETKTMITNWAQASDSKEQKEMLFLPMKDANGETECNKISPAVTPSLTSPSRFCSWDPEEERKRQERWQHEQERLLQERYQKEQEKLKEEWEKAQKEVEEEERKYYEEERKIIEDTVMPLTVSPVADVNVSMSERNGNVGVPEDNHEKEDMKAGTLWTESQGCLIESIQTKNDKPQTLWEQEGAFLGAEEEYAKGTKQRQEMVENESEMRNHHNSVNESNTPTKCILQPGLQEDQHVASPENHLPVVTDSPNNFLDGRSSPMITRGTDGQENMRGVGYPSQSSASQCQSPNRSVSGKKLCSTCGLPLGKGAAMIIEKLSLYFHIQCFKCGICKGQLGDATTGTDVRIRNGLLNCNDCYVRSRTAGHPTPL
ncbi:LIM and calponin homology domains-containing 1 isoform X1 [Pelobates cultripes]|uniref:LIM and calponin homology domains-containing 1 isoform X1 n=1 Tax=Pelobates cultripes TaxID=61616 RepID=A0AAD1SEM8_PELCU|nr:LIM and calponin homology domains-containing 1 isoform X1 [Pelobates cultripes]